MTETKNGSKQKAYIITGPTSGIGRATALQVAKHGTVILVGRDLGKLQEVGKVIERAGGHAVQVECDLSNLASVRRAAATIIGLRLPLVGLVNNAGILQLTATKSAKAGI
jgi:NAD(P)-dependent dehydrogenase (short-subunit alcohol dehydrogenase family)